MNSKENSKILSSSRMSRSSFMSNNSDKSLDNFGNNQSGAIKKFRQYANIIKKAIKQDKEETQINDQNNEEN